MRDRVVLLCSDTGVASLPGGAPPSATLLEMSGRRCVVDCGLGATRALAAAGVDPATLDHIFVTHLHAGHVLELGPLLHSAWMAGLSRPVDVWGPPGIEVHLDGFLRAMAQDITLRVHDEGRPPLAGLIRLHVYAEGEVLAEPGLRVTALQVPHPPMENCFALRFDGAAGVAFSGDTAPHPPLADFARGCAVLLHEAMLPAGIAAIAGQDVRLGNRYYMAHSTVEDAARIAREAGVDRLVLHHRIPAAGFGPGDWLAQARRVWDGEVVLGRDGLEIAL